MLFTEVLNIYQQRVKLRRKKKYKTKLQKLKYEKG